MGRPELPTGRRARKRDAAATKESFLVAAAMLFTDRGFDRTTVRDIANQAGANQALLFRYFGSKEALFEEVIAREARDHLSATPPEQLLEVALRSMLTPGKGSQRHRSLQAFLRSAGQDSAATASRRKLGEDYVQALATLTDAPDAELRADLILAWLLGIGLVRDVTRKEPLAGADPDEVCALVIRAAGLLLERFPPQEHVLDART